jgi:hypothetical protein
MWFQISAFAISHPEQRRVPPLILNKIQGVKLKSGPYFNMSNLFTKIYMLYYTTNLYLQ